MSFSLFRRKYDVEDDVRAINKNVAFCDVLLGMTSSEKIKNELEYVKNEIKFMNPYGTSLAARYERRIKYKLDDLKSLLQKRKRERKIIKVLTEIKFVLSERKELN